MDAGEDDRMSVEDNKSMPEDIPTATEDEDVPVLDAEGERIYDRKASLPDYKLFTLR